MTELPDRSRWLALYVLCLGDLMIVLDSSIVNVALPSIQADLGFSQSALAWVVNAYLLTFGGFLLLSGRLGDLLGNKRVFQGGVVSFTVASVACGLAPSPELLVVGRAVQGLGGAAVSAVALALVMGLFSEPAERAKAMGFFGFVMSGGGAVGVLLGGVLTGLLSWHWIFLVNVPIGVAVWVAARRALPSDELAPQTSRLDVVGAALVTIALMVTVYAVVGGNEAGWTSARTLLLLALGALLLVAYDALEVGLAFIPTSVVMAYCSLRVSDRLVLRFGIRPPLVAGLALAATSLALFSRAPVDGAFAIDVLPAMLLLGAGAGVAFNPVLLAAMGDVEPDEAGLASGVVNTSFMMGGALGLAVLVSLSTARTESLLDGGASPVAALNGGYQLGFAVGAAFALLAAAVGGLLLRPKPMVDAHPHEPTPAGEATAAGSP
ncbi:MFS transporter [Nocardioides sp. cx-173]|uniref:MFS transporter n=1 Tax=Nocardioides sp. cx-173 TaxID=2898796 RepID=UPI001E374386|nr:MFS transporter [Nocardioides sp. cx-173]MCD4523935.1 MFS transporter [Nocardioides sp. cx-173]UGB41749.1 MFS transporter [Nocardioides sp. cx-173]